VWTSAFCYGFYSNGLYIGATMGGVLATMVAVTAVWLAIIFTSDRTVYLECLKLGQAKLWNITTITCEVKK